MDGKRLMCRIETSGPTMNEIVARKVKVLYPVRHITYTPNNTHYEVGSIINCSADGNPQPEFQWVEMDTDTRIQGQSLLISEQMVGSNTWKCMANNTVSGHTHQGSVLTVFVVVGLEDHIPSPISGTDFWKVAVGITISILLVIAGLTAWYCLWRLKRPNYHSVPTEEKIIFENSNSIIKTISEVRESEEDGVYCKMKQAMIDPKDDYNYKIPLDNVVLLIPSKAVTKPVIVSVKERYTFRKRVQDIKASGLNEILRPVIQLSLEPLGLKLAKPAEVRVKNKKVTKLDKLLVFNKPQQDSLWTDITNHCAMEVTDEGVVFRVSVLADIEILLSNSATADVSSQATAMLNILHFPCNFYVYYKPTVSMLKLFIEALTDNNQTNRHEEPRDCAPVGAGTSNQSLADNSVLKFYYDSCIDVVGEYTLKMEQCKTHWDNFDFPVTVKRIGELPDCIKIYQKESNEEKRISIIHIEKSSNKIDKIIHTELSEIFASLDHWKDLDENTAERIKGLLDELKDEPPYEGPSPLSQLIKKAESLIESIHFVPVTKALAQKFTKLLEKNHEDPLLYLVAVLEKNYPFPLTGHPEELLELIKVLLKVDGPTSTRSQCFRILIMKTMEWRMCQGEWIVQDEVSRDTKQLQWNSNFIKVMQTLVERGADSAWSPKGSSYGSNMHLLVCAIKHIISHETDRFKNVMDLLEFMMTDASVSCNNIDGEGRTILHTLMDGRTTLLPDTMKQLLQSIMLITKRNPSLLDATNGLKQTPLHTFVTSILSVSVNGQFDSERDQVPAETTEWKDDNHTCLQILSCLISGTNIDLPCSKGETPLHYFIRYAQKRQVDPDMFLEIVKCLKSPDNIHYQDKNGDTALSIFTSAANIWEDSPNIFLNIVICLIAESNIESYDIRKHNPLMKFISAASKWAKQPDVFFEVVKCLKSDSNINLQSKDTLTPLFVFTAAAKKWSYQPDIFFKVVKCLKSDFNINLQSEGKLTPLFVFTIAVKEWANQPDFFLEVVKCLRSDSNVNLHTEDNKTPLLVFTAAADEWVNKPDIFFEVVKCLKSDSNINLESVNEVTPLFVFTAAAKAWANQAHTFYEVVKCLKSDLNVDLHDKDKLTPLHAFVVAAKEWVNEPDIFFEVVRCLRSVSNVNFQNENKQTPLFSFTYAAEEWANQPDVFFKVVKLLKSDYNVNIQSKDKATPLLLFTIAAKEWANQPDIFFEVVKCLKSDSNVNFQIDDKWTPLCLFTSAAKEWASDNQSNIFLEIVKCLKSPFSVDAQTKTGILPLHEVMKAADKWVKYPDTFLKVLECLISHANIHLQTMEGDTAFDLFKKYANNWSSQQSSKIVECLHSYSKKGDQDSNGKPS